MVFFFGMCAHMTMINKARMNPLEMCVLASPFLLGFIHSSLAMHVKETTKDVVFFWSWEYSSGVIMKSEFIFFVKLHVTFCILIVDDLKLLCMG